MNNDDLFDIDLIVKCVSSASFSLEVIRAAQRNRSDAMDEWLGLDAVRRHIRTNERGYILYRDKIWLPQDQEELLHRVCIGAHIEKWSSRRTL
jgi:hypothetical protein